MRAARPWVALLLSLWATSLCQGFGWQTWAWADPPEAGKPRKLILAVLNQVTWHDLLSEETNAPVLRRLVREGAVGMMCVRTARGAGPEGAYVTIGAGTRVVAHDRDDKRALLEGQAYHRGELVEGVPAGQLYQARTGWPVGDNSIVHLGIGELIRENAASSYPVHLGLMGGALRRAGLRVACVGNADTPQSVHRELVGIGMDEQGLVPLGSVGRGLLRWQTDLPYLYTTDPTRMAADVARALAEADLVVVELGETARAEEYAEVTAAGAAESVRSRAIEKSDRLLGEVLGALPKEGWELLLVTPSVRAAAPLEQFSALAPVIMYGPGVRPGLLTSPSTRRAGVVVNTDIAATVLAYFGLLRPPDTVGRAMFGEGTRRDHAEWLNQQVGRQDMLEASRRSVFRWLPAHIAVAMWLAAFLLLLGQRAPRWARAGARGLLLIAMAGPVAALLAAPLALSAPLAAGASAAAAPLMVAAIIGGAAALALVSCWLTAWRSADAVPAALVVGALVYDLIFGRTMLEWSPLSYSVAAGARFYGIGNEYAGVLLGAALVSGASLLPPRPKWTAGASAGPRARPRVPAARCWWGERFAAALVLIGLVVMVGHPRLGADYGTALGCAVGFGVFVLYLWREQPAWRDAALVFWIAFGLVGALVLADVFMRGAQASHVGLLATQVRDMGWQPVWQAAARKLAMNWLLLRASPWTDAAAASVGLLAVVLAARPQAVLEALDEREWLRPAVLACMVGAVASFALNDSGVVAAALALLYGVGSLAYLGLAEPARVGG